MRLVSILVGLGLFRAGHWKLVIFTHPSGDLMSVERLCISSNVKLFSNTGIAQRTRNGFGNLSICPIISVISAVQKKLIISKNNRKLTPPDSDSSLEKAIWSKNLSFVYKTAKNTAVIFYIGLFCSRKLHLGIRLFDCNPVT